MKLKHNKTGRIFEYVQTTKQQFVGEVVELLNTHTGKTEKFMASTYLNHFTKL